MTPRRFVVLFLATGGFVPYIPKKIFPNTKWTGAGLWGTFVGVLIAFACPPNGPAFWLTAAALTAVAVWTGGGAEKYLESHDDPRIVIDEVAGVFLASAYVPRFWWPDILAVFVLFRIFDVFKGPWGKAAAKLPGGWGIVADDLLAGVLAGVFYWLALTLLNFQ